MIIVPSIAQIVHMGHVQLSPTNLGSLPNTRLSYSLMKLQFWVLPTTLFALVRWNKKYIVPLILENQHGLALEFTID